MKQLAIIAVLMVAATTASASELIVRGLFKNAVLLEINGQQQLVRTGSSHPGGAKVLSANSRFAQVRYQGKTHRLTLNKRIGTLYAESERQEVDDGYIGCDDRAGTQRSDRRRRAQCRKPEGHL